MNRIAPILFSLLLAVGAATQAQETNSGGGPDLKSFEMIWRNNIFDQSRVGLRSNDGRPRQPRVEHLILNGIGAGLGDAEAAFGGVGSSDGMLKLGDRVGGFELSQITPDSVKLTNGTNTFVLDMVSRRSLRRVDNGPWEGSTDQAEAVDISTNTADETAVSTPAAADAARPGESAIERRLRLRREQEEK
jgi:hypothetical protein